MSSKICCFYFIGVFLTGAQGPQELHIPASTLPLTFSTHCSPHPTKSMHHTAVTGILWKPVRSCHSLLKTHQKLPFTFRITFESYFIQEQGLDYFSDLISYFFYSPVLFIISQTFQQTSASGHLHPLFPLSKTHSLVSPMHDLLPHFIQVSARMMSHYKGFFYLK